MESGAKFKFALDCFSLKLFKATLRYWLTKSLPSGTVPKSISRGLWTFALWVF